MTAEYSLLAAAFSVLGVLVVSIFPAAIYPIGLGCIVTGAMAISHSVGTMRHHPQSVDWGVSLRSIMWKRRPTAIFKPRGSAPLA